MASAKIVLKSNSSNITESNAEFFHSYSLKSSNAQFSGIDYGQVKSLDKTLISNALLHIDKFISKKQPSSEDKRNSNVKNSAIASALSESSEYINKFLADSELLNPVDLHFNVDSDLNNGIKKIAQFAAKIPFLGRFQDTILSAFNSVDDHAGYAQLWENKIVIGSNLFSGSDFANSLVNSIGLSDTVSMVAYHELSHILQTRQYNTNHTDSITIKFLENWSEMSRNPSDPKVISLNENKSCTAFLGNITELMMEIYADTGALLLKRNHDIDKNSFNEVEFLHTCDALKTARIKDINKFDFLSVNHKIGMPHFGHLTSPALDAIESKFTNLPENILSIKEINQIGHEAASLGLARMLLVGMAINHKVKDAMKIIFNYSNDYANLSEFEKNALGNKNFKISIKDLESLAGDEWSSQFNLNVSEINHFIENGYMSKESGEMQSCENKAKAIWLAGTDIKGFKSEFSAEIAKNLKFIVDKTDSIDFNGVKLYRVIANKDLFTQYDYIPKGSLGPYVASAENLSQFGKCWAGSDVLIIDKKSRISNDAFATGKVILNNSKLSGFAEVRGANHWLATPPPPSLNTKESAMTPTDKYCNHSKIIRSELSGEIMCSKKLVIDVNLNGNSILKDEQTVQQIPKRVIKNDVSNGFDSPPPLRRVNSSLSL